MQFLKEFNPPSPIHFRKTSDSRFHSFFMTLRPINIEFQGRRLGLYPAHTHTFSSSAHGHTHTLCAHTCTHTAHTCAHTLHTHAHILHTHPHTHACTAHTCTHIAHTHCTQTHTLHAHTHTHTAHMKSSCMLTVVQPLSHVRLCGPMDCSRPGFPVLHHRPEFTQVHVV